MAQGIIVASSNGSVGIEAAMEVLRSGGSALDAVVTALALVEANPDDHSVGFSGLPNMLGQVELDASLMEGKGLRAGSVAALQDYQDAAVLARSVMDGLPHVLIVGEGAKRLAAETGLEPKDLTTPESLEIWRSRTDELATLGSGGRSTATTILSAAAVRSLLTDPTVDAREKKLLAFSDNRQDASLQAGQTYRSTAA